MRIRHALIMAAGRGTRMRPLTDSIPKAMAPYKGSTLIANGIEKLKPLVAHIHITVGYKGAVLAEHVMGLEVSSVFNTNGKGNSFWIYNTLMSFLDEPVLVLTADNVTEIDTEFISDQYEQYGSPSCMLVPVKPVEGLEGDYVHQENNQVRQLSREVPAESYCSGIQVINPAEINRLTDPTEDFNALWDQLISQEQLFCSNDYPKNWFTVDTIEQLSKLNEDHT